MSNQLAVLCAGEALCWRTCKATPFKTRGGFGNQHSPAGCRLATVPGACCGGAQHILPTRLLSVYYWS